MSPIGTIRHIIGASGTAIAAVALLAFLGYAVGDPKLYLWAGTDGMAMNSAVCHLIAGVCFIILALSDKYWGRK